MAGLLTRIGALFGVRSSTTLLEAASPRRFDRLDRPALLASTATLNLDTVRQRSRHAALNSPHMARAAEVWPAALVGAGIVTASGHPSPAIRRDLQQRFTAWGLRCDAGGRLDWPGLQVAIVREVEVSGEAFVHVRYGPGGRGCRPKWKSQDCFSQPASV